MSENGRSKIVRFGLFVEGGLFCDYEFPMAEAIFKSYEKIMKTGWIEAEDFEIPYIAEQLIAEELLCQKK